MNNNFTMEYLKELQSYPLDIKVSLTKARIREWINKFGIEGVYISFSGGKDSTVLLDIVRELYPKIEAVFVDVPTQYPELKEFVKTFDNVTILKPKINFAQVCKKYGFPLISKEVSESVEGARKYLTQIINEYDALTDRQTDRQIDSDRRISITTKKYADSVSMQNPSRGGYDNKYRKLRGIGEYSKQKNGEQDGRRKSETCDNARDANKRSDDKGEYP